jgi:hypothetical protein
LASVKVTLDPGFACGQAQSGFEGSFVVMPQATIVWMTSKNFGLMAVDNLN